MGPQKRRSHMSGAGSPERPAFYVRGHGRTRDLLAILHPPYTLWHLSYVVVGATAAPKMSWTLLGLTVAAFFLAVGVAAHALDELHGRPLSTNLSAAALKVLAGATLAGAVAIGAAEVVLVGTWFLLLVAIGPVLVVGYNLELFHGRLHTDWAFAASWGGFPALVGYVVENRGVTLSALAIAAAATGVSLAQRTLSTQARFLRRQVAAVEGTLALRGGGRTELNRPFLLQPVEAALLALSWSVVLLALGLAGARAGF